MDENKQNDKPWSALGFAWELGYSIVIPIMIFALVGRILDKKMDTSPWFLLLESSFQSL
jgi:F0F1-type ATP synthase assembly protein I